VAGVAQAARAVEPATAARVALLSVLKCRSPLPILALLEVVAAVAEEEAEAEASAVAGTLAAAVAAVVAALRLEVPEVAVLLLVFMGRAAAAGLVRLLALTVVGLVIARQARVAAAEVALVARAEVPEAAEPLGVITTQCWSIQVVAAALPALAHRATQTLHGLRLAPATAH
jgi:hypothetical protein